MTDHAAATLAALRADMQHANEPGELRTDIEVEAERAALEHCRRVFGRTVLWSSLPSQVRHEWLKFVAAARDILPEPVCTCFDLEGTTTACPVCGPEPNATSSLAALCAAAERWRLVQTAWDDMQHANQTPTAAPLPARALHTTRRTGWAALR